MNWLLMWFLLAFGQSQAPTTPPPPPPPLETGSMQDGMYRNDQLGLVFRFPIRVKQLRSFAPDEKLVKKGKIPHHKYLLLSTYGSVGSSGEGTLNAGRAQSAENSTSEGLPSNAGRTFGETKQYGEKYGDTGYTGRVVRIIAYYDQYYANSEDAIAYLRKQGKNAKTVRDAEECTFDGHKFYRSDFVRVSSPSLYWSEARGTYVWLATVWRGYLLVINYWTDDTAENDKNGITSLMHSMDTIRLFDPNSPEAPPTTTGNESGHPPS